MSEARTARPVGLISNPKSQQNRRGMSGIEREAERAGMVHRVLNEMTELPAALDDLAGREVGLLVVNGGDGTLQAVLSALLVDRPFDRLPLLAALPRGMTNMSAFDVGLRGKPHRALARLAAAWARREVSSGIVTRRVLRADNIPGSPPQCAMFFGAGGIVRAIDYCKSKVHPWRIGADVASGLTLAGILAAWALRGGRSEVVTGQRIAMSLDDAEEAPREMLLVLATTLDKLVLGSRPFWNQKGEPLRFTAVAFPPERLLRSIRKVLYGGNERNLPAACYASGGAEVLRLRFDGQFTLDGQMFDAPGDGPLSISAPDRVEFVRI